MAACDFDYVTTDNICVESCSNPETYFDQGQDIPKLCRACTSYEIQVD